MPGPFPPIVSNFPHFLHGADYNPDQWTPNVWEDDMRLMKLAHCNSQTVGIFSWVHLEPEEGHYTFDWLDTILDKLHENGAVAVIATPSAKPPAWLSHKYPETLRVGSDRVRRLHGNRVNNCWTSPVFREKCRRMAHLLAERYGDHPALGVWHVFNEYGGECHCDLCEAAFRGWLQRKYGTLDQLNHEYWAKFWGSDYTDWSQIHSPGGPYGETALMGLTLDWKRFTTDQVVDAYRNEADELRKVTPDVPVTTNMMGTFSGLNYWKFMPYIDVASWDNYPFFHDREDNWKTACANGFIHDIYRTFKGGKPFMLMESTPSSCNWMPVMKLKRPGVHRLASLQAVAHGADTVQYFQWRASRGGMEKFHGAVVTHNGDENTRVFRDVAEVGDILGKLNPVVGTSVTAEVAILYDWENNWAIETAVGPRQKDKDYTGTCMAHYRPFWSRGIPVDVPDMDSDFSKYRLLIAPMLYMVRHGVAERIEEFVRNGGTFVATYLSGIANENDLVFGGGFPGPLRQLLGIWSEEIDALYDDEKATIRAAADNPLGLMGIYEAKLLCDLIHSEGATVLATYGDQFYAGRPALTVNAYGSGEAYYVASRNDERFQDEFFGGLIRKLELKRALDARLPQGVTVQMRSDGETDFLFVLNFRNLKQNVNLNETGLIDHLSGESVEGVVELASYGSMVLRRPNKSG